MNAERIEYRIAEGVLARSLGESLVLFHPVTERLLSLNASGARIWQHLAECGSAAQITGRLSDEFAGSKAAIQRDVAAFLSQLENEQIIRRQE